MTTQVQTLPRLDPHFIYGFDALGTLAFGVALLFTAAPLTELAVWALPSGFLWVLGLLLVPWAAFNLWIARSGRPSRVVVAVNIIGDVIWVAGTAALLAIHATGLSSLGLALLVGQGIAVGGILALKLIGRNALVG
ncbi:hypothetical protein [Devosia sp.]|uniref:hypothetical protein n=1 Tax=Devosia sp. TaxID=1871048 RepID=UPI002FC7DC6C